MLGTEEGWCADYTRAAYTRWFVAHDEAGSESSNRACLREIGQDPERVIESDPNGGDRRALYGIDRGGAQTWHIRRADFAVGKELFWGDDRLEDAVRWHAKGTLLRR